MDNREKLSPKEWTRCDIQLLRLRQGIPTDEGRKLECTANDLAAWRIEKGSAEVRTSKCRFTVNAGEWLFLPNGYLRQEFSEDVRLTSIAFSAYWPNSLRPVLDLRPGLHIKRDRRLDECLNSLRQPLPDEEEYEWHYQHDSLDLESLLAMDGWFRTWLSHAIRLWRKHLPKLETPRDIDPRVEAARQWLTTQPLNAPLLNLEGAAIASGMSSGHLNRLFIHHYHQTMHGLHEQRRLQFARQALLQPGARIKEVALELGITDLSRFSSWFRRLEQMSPRKFQGRSARTRHE